MKKYYLTSTWTNINKQGEKVSVDQDVDVFAKDEETAKFIAMYYEYIRDDKTDPRDN